MQSPCAPHGQIAASLHRWPECLPLSTSSLYIHIPMLYIHIRSLYVQDSRPKATVPLRTLIQIFNPKTLLGMVLPTPASSISQKCSPPFGFCLSLREARVHESLGSAHSIRYIPTLSSKSTLYLVRFFLFIQSIHALAGTSFLSIQ